MQVVHIQMYRAGVGAEMQCVCCDSGTTFYDKCRCVALSSCGWGCTPEYLRWVAQDRMDVPTKQNSVHAQDHVVGGVLPTKQKDREEWGAHDDVVTCGDMQ
jgi:hypothetical protein